MGAQILFIVVSTVVLWTALVLGFNIRNNDVKVGAMVVIFMIIVQVTNRWGH